MQIELMLFFFQRKVFFGERWTGRNSSWEQSSSSLTGNDSLQKTQSFLPALFSRRSWFHWPRKVTCRWERWRPGSGTGRPRTTPGWWRSSVRPGSWVSFWWWRPPSGLHIITTLCPVLTPNTLPGELLWLRVEPLPHEAGSHYCTHWQQSPPQHWQLPPPSSFPFLPLKS